MPSSRFKKWFAVLVLCSICSTSLAKVNTGRTKIVRIYSYATAGGGDTLIVPQHPIADCDGFWLDNADPGYQGNLSTALSMYHANADVVLYGDEIQMFTGSSNKFCKLTVLVSLKD